MSTFVVHQEHFPHRASVIEAEGPEEAAAIDYKRWGQADGENRRALVVSPIGEPRTFTVWTERENSEDTWESRWVRRVRVAPSAPTRPSLGNAAASRPRA